LLPKTFPLKRKSLPNPLLADPKVDLSFRRFVWGKFYGFSKDPFDSQPDPRLMFLTENVREVWNSILSGIVQRKEFLLLTGEKGIGKTTLISIIYLYFATANSQKVKVVPLFDSVQNIEQILRIVLRSLGFSAAGESKGSMLRRLDEELVQRSKRGESVALIFDEAQNLIRETLEEIRILANSNPRRPRLLQEIFVGDPQFEKDLSKDLIAINQRIDVRCRLRLRPLTAEESLGYIEQRLNRAGNTTCRVFTPRAVSLIIQASGGNPEALNRISWEALAAGHSQLKKKIDLGSVREALANLGMEKEAGRLSSPETRP